MNSFSRLIVLSVAVTLALSVGNVVTWGGECTPTQFLSQEPPTRYWAPIPDEVRMALRQCFADSMIDQFELVAVRELIGEHSGYAYLGANFSWNMPDPFGVQFSGALWRNPGMIVLPEGTLCTMAHSLSYWSDDVGIFAELTEITHGTGAYADVTGWWVVNPLGRIGTNASLGRGDGWICTP